MIYRRGIAQLRPCFMLKAGSWGVRATSSTPKPAEQEQAVEVLVRHAEKAIYNHEVMHSDQLVGVIQDIHDAGHRVPYAQLSSALGVLCRRQDIERSEYMMHLARENEASFGRTMHYTYKIIGTGLRLLAAQGLPGVNAVWARMATYGFQPNEKFLMDLVKVYRRHTARPTRKVVLRLKEAMVDKAWFDPCKHYFPLVGALGNCCHAAVTEKEFKKVVVELEALETEARAAVEYNEAATPMQLLSLYTSIAQAWVQISSVAGRLGDESASVSALAFAQEAVLTALGLPVCGTALGHYRRGGYTYLCRLREAVGQVCGGLAAQNTPESRAALLVVVEAAKDSAVLSAAAPVQVNGSGDVDSRVVSPSSSSSSSSSVTLSADLSLQTTNASIALRELSRLSHGQFITRIANRCVTLSGTVSGADPDVSEVVDLFRRDMEGIEVLATMLLEVVGEEADGGTVARGEIVACWLRAMRNAYTARVLAVEASAGAGAAHTVIEEVRQLTDMCAEGARTVMAHTVDSSHMPIAVARADLLSSLRSREAFSGALGIYLEHVRRSGGPRTDWNSVAAANLLDEDDDGDDEYSARGGSVMGMDLEGMRTALIMNASDHRSDIDRRALQALVKLFTGKGTKRDCRSLGLEASALQYFDPVDRSLHARAPFKAALVKAYARLFQGGAALKVVQALRRGGEKVPRKTYHHVMTALQPRGKAHSNVQSAAYLREPEALVNFLLENMRQDGISMSGQTLELMMGLYVQGCKLYLKEEEEEEGHVGGIHYNHDDDNDDGDGDDNGDDDADHGDKDYSDSDSDAYLGGSEGALEVGGVEQVLARMVAQGEQLCADFLLGAGRKGMRAVSPTEGPLTLLVELYSVAGMTKRARDMLTSMEITYNVRPSATSYRPVVYADSCVRHDWYAVEDTLQDMTNRGVKPTASIVHAVVRGRAREGDVSAAVDFVQEVYNQHGVRPSPRALYGLLNFALKQAGKHEAQRAAAVVRQLYGEEERERLVFVDHVQDAERPVQMAHLSETRLRVLLNA